MASSRDALRADSDLRAYRPCHRRDGTADTPELLPQLSQPGLGTISDDYGPAAIRRSIWNPVHLNINTQIGTYWYVLVRTSLYQYQQVQEFPDWYKMVQDGTGQYQIS